MGLQGTTRLANIDYTNYRGERAIRRVQPMSIEFTQGNKWHPYPHFYLNAIDVEKGETRHFPMHSIHSWTDVVS